MFTITEHAGRSSTITLVQVAYFVSSNPEVDSEPKKTLKNHNTVFTVQLLQCLNIDNGHELITMN